MNWADIFNAGSDVVIFGYDWYPSLWLLNAGGPQQLYLWMLTPYICLGSTDYSFFHFIRLSKSF